MNENFVEYRAYRDKRDAQDLIDILDDHKIEYILEDNSLPLDINAVLGGGGDNMRLYVLKIDKKDFERVDAFEEECLKKEVENMDKDYYLYEYTDDELMEIILKKEEWNKFDYLAAQKILKERNKEINPELLTAINKLRVEDLSKPEESQKVMIYAGYFFAIIGGFIGFFIGLSLMYYKKTLPDGTVVYGFSEKDRKQGKNILVCSIICIVFWLFVRFYVIM